MQTWRDIERSERGRRSGSSGSGSKGYTSQARVDLRAVKGAGGIAFQGVPVRADESRIVMAKIEPIAGFPFSLGVRWSRWKVSAWPQDRSGDLYVSTAHDCASSERRYNAHMGTEAGTLHVSRRRLSLSGQDSRI